MCLQGGTARSGKLPASFFFHFFMFSCFFLLFFFFFIFSFFSFFKKTFFHFFNFFTASAPKSLNDRSPFGVDADVIDI